MGTGGVHRGWSVPSTGPMNRRERRLAYVIRAGQYWSALAPPLMYSASFLVTMDMPRAAYTGSCIFVALMALAGCITKNVRRKEGKKVIGYLVRALATAFARRWVAALTMLPRSSTTVSSLSRDGVSPMAGDETKHEGKSERSVCC